MLHSRPKVIVSQEGQTILTGQITLQCTNTNNLKQLLNQETSSRKILPCSSKCYLLCISSFCLHKLYTTARTMVIAQCKNSQNKGQKAAQHKSSNTTKPVKVITYKKDKVFWCLVAQTQILQTCSHSLSLD